VLLADRPELILWSLLKNLILQIAEDFFSGLDDLVHLLGVFVADEYADAKNHNKYKHLDLPFLSEFNLVRVP
jgi:hypothetical protein